jgi:hypothetical protein
VSGRYARELIRVGSEAFEVVFKRPQPLFVSLAREGYRFRDEGALIVENQSGMDCVLEVFCKEGFVRFAERHYVVNGNMEIPFSIRMSALQSAQLLFRKQPGAGAVIEVKAVMGETVYKKNLCLTAGEW